MYRTLFLESIADIFLLHKKDTIITIVSLNNETSGIRTPDNLIKSQVLYQLS